MNGYPYQDTALERFLADERLRLRTVAFRKNQPVFFQGDVSDALFYVREGSVKLVVVSARGKEAVLAFLRRGDMFGEECLAERPSRMAGAVAFTPCSLIKIEVAQLKRLCGESRPFLEVLTARVVSRGLRTAQDLADQLLYPSDQRLARTLLLLAETLRPETGDCPAPTIDQATLAGKVGTTRSRVNYFMNKFKRLGMIEYRDGLRVYPALLSTLRKDEDCILDS